MRLAIRELVRTSVALFIALLSLALPGTGFAQSKSARDERATIGRAAWNEMRYAVIVGDMRDATSFSGVDLAPKLADGVARRLREISRVVVLHAREATDALLDRIARRRLPMLRVEGTVMSLEQGSLDGAPSLRCQVSLVLMDERGRALRSVLRGAATGIESRRDPATLRTALLVQRALDGALDSAMHGAVEVLAGASRQASLAPRADGRLALR